MDKSFFENLKNSVDYQSNAKKEDSILPFHIENNQLEGTFLDKYCFEYKCRKI